MPFSAQKLFPLKYSVLWKLSFEHFSNCRFSTFLSNQHFLRFFPTVTWGFAYTLICSRHPEVTYQSCRGISAGVFCTFLVYCQIPWDSIRILDNSGTEKLSPRTVPGGTQPCSVFRAVDYQLVIKCSVEMRPKKACMSTPQLFSTLLTFVCLGFAAIIYCLPAYYMSA